MSDCCFNASEFVDNIGCVRAEVAEIAKVFEGLFVAVTRDEPTGRFDKVEGAEEQKAAGLSSTKREISLEDEEEEEGRGHTMSWTAKAMSHWDLDSGTFSMTP